MENRRNLREVRRDTLGGKSNIFPFLILILIYHVMLLTVVFAEVKTDATTKASPKYEVKNSTAAAPAVKKTAEPEPAKTNLPPAAKPKIDRRTNIQKLKDTNWLVRRNAAISLGTEKNKNAVTPLINLLKDGNTQVRRCAAVALGEIGDSQAIPHLIKTLGDPDGGMIIDSANALASFKDSSAIPAFKKLLSDGRPVIRITALKALTVFSDKPEVRVLIVECLNDEAEGVRIAAVQFVSALKLRAAVPNLIKNLNDVNSTVRIESIKALAVIGDKSAVEPLKKIAADENKEVAASVKEAISKLEERK